MSATYHVETVARAPDALTLRCSITHPDVIYLPLPGHHPTWARLLLLADHGKEWETLRRDEVWALSDRIASVELLELSDHPRVRYSERPRITARLGFHGAPPDVPDGWDAWLTLGDDSAAAWDPVSPKAVAGLVGVDREAAAGPDTLAQRLEKLREQSRGGFGSAPHEIARGLNLGVVATESRAAAIRSVLDALHLTGNRLSSIALLVDPAAEVVATTVVLAGQGRLGLALPLLGPAAMPHAAVILGRLAEARRLAGTSEDVVRHAVPVTAYEQLARRQCLADRTPIPARALTELGREIAFCMPAACSMSAGWSAAEKTAFDKGVAAAEATLAKMKANLAQIAKKAAAKKKATKR